MAKKKDLREIVAQLGSQKSVAQSLGITQGTLNGYLCGRWEPSSEVIVRLCGLCMLEHLPEELFPKKDWEWLYDFIELYNKTRR